MNNIKQKPIPNWPEYEITDDGKVWSKRRHKYLKPKTDKDGYYVLSLSRNNKKSWYSIHRLVLITFIGPCPQNMQCRHLDNNKTNNNINNLCWGTAKENVQDLVKINKHGGFMRKGEKHPLHRLTIQVIRTIIYMWLTGLFSQREIGNIYNVNHQHISRIINKKRWGHVWNN